MLEANFTNQFVKDAKLLQKRGRDLEALFEVLVEIIWGEPLPVHNKEHYLSGDYSGYTECHNPRRSFPQSHLLTIPPHSSTLTPIDKGVLCAAACIGRTGGGRFFCERFNKSMFQN